MLKNALLSVVIFAAVLIALTFGEKVFSAFASWVYELTGIAIINLSSIYHSLKGYVMQDPIKIALALIITSIISFWLFKNNNAKLKEKGTPRKLAIVLAIFLGWLGVHRFYLNQILSGLLYLIISQLFLPLSVVLSLIDAIRYVSMDDHSFEQRFKP
ncbi:TM2 domain-containing protein [Oligella urethralis]|uniref:TM2 domain-containing protein n=1 Tax=Oligella urethralis TaxID=90245 RepID=UPI0027B899D0|nr:TM2 domain-containing protein [Oligella urethralis]